MYFLFYFAAILTLPLLIQWYLRSTYKKYQNIQPANTLSGAAVAKKILQENNIQDVKVEPTKGVLTDHYDPSSKTVRLSEHNYHSGSISALSVSAHEVGHAIQHHEAYGPLQLRSSLVPVASLGSSLSFGFILGGLLFQLSGLLLAGILFFAASLLFQVVTLPVEFNASSRAREQLVSTGIIANNEESGVKKVLNAAALTYVAATAVAALELLRFIWMYLNMND